MSAIEVEIPIPEPRRHLRQLCAHFGDRLGVSFSAEEGSIAFADRSRCRVKAQRDALQLRVEAIDAARATRVGEVVIAHLAHLAARAPLVIPPWRAA